MTKDELIKALQESNAPGDAKVIKFVADEIAYADPENKFLKLHLVSGTFEVTELITAKGGIIIN
jgi:hypothetical protein